MKVKNNRIKNIKNDKNVNSYSIIVTSNLINIKIGRLIIVVYS